MGRGEQNSLDGADDGVAVSLTDRAADLTGAVGARARTYVALDGRAVPLGHDDRPELPALARRRLVVPRSRTLRQYSLERLPEFCVEDAVDYRVEGRVAVTQPGKYLRIQRRICYFILFY